MPTTATAPTELIDKITKKYFDRKKLVVLSVCVLAFFAGIYYYFTTSAECPGGYEGEDCVDVDECSTNKHACHENFNCRNTPGSFECYCLDGFNATQENCVDIDECSTALHTCNKNFDCKNTQGSFECYCLDGFNATEENCVDIDECSTTLHTCHNNFNCKNTEGSFECHCSEGFSKNDENCIDIDEDIIAS